MLTSILVYLYTLYTHIKSVKCPTSIYRNSALDNRARQQSLKNFNATFCPSWPSSGIQYTVYCMPDEARDRQNVALKFLSDCWRARLSKAELLHQNFSMPNIFHDSPTSVVRKMLTAQVQAVQSDIAVVRVLSMNDSTCQHHSHIGDGNKHGQTDRQKATLHSPFMAAVSGSLGGSDCPLAG